MKHKLHVLRELHANHATIHEFNDLYFAAINNDIHAKEKRDFITMGSREFFKTVYGQALKQAHEQNPSEYVWPAYELLMVFSRMCVAIDKGTFNKDSKAFKITCKVLGIKHTYKAINEYLDSFI